MGEQNRNPSAGSTFRARTLALTTIGYLLSRMKYREGGEGVSRRIRQRLDRGLANGCLRPKADVSGQAAELLANYYT